MVELDPLRFATGLSAKLATRYLVLTWRLPLIGSAADGSSADVVCAESTSPHPASSAEPFPWQA